MKYDLKQNGDLELRITRREKRRGDVERLRNKGRLVSRPALRSTCCAKLVRPAKQKLPEWVLDEYAAAVEYDHTVAHISDDGRHFLLFAGGVLREINHE